MSKIYESILDTVGNTPIVRINKLNKGKANVFAKVEYFNPAGSVKDRVAARMIEDAEKAGVIQPGATIIEPTSGNTGIGLALAAAVKGYRLILTMPETMSVERRKLVAAYGAKVELTPGARGMLGAIERANELHASIPGSWIPMQFENPSNPAAHYETTGKEIWDALDGKVDAFVAGVGTGGTVSGVAKYLKERNPNVKAIAVDRQLRPRRNRRNYPRLFRRRGQDGAPRGDPGGAPRRNLVRRESLDRAPAEQTARI